MRVIGRIIGFFLSCLLVMMLSACSNHIVNFPKRWHVDERADLLQAVNLSPNTNKAKNIILFIGDGMGVSTVTAARILQGQQQGRSGEENILSFERFPNLGLSKTYSTNSQVAQSAATMSAMMTGVKTKDDVLSLNARAVPGQCDSQFGNETQTFLETVEAAGLASGIVTSAGVTHATPAATYAHSVHRKWENDAKIPEAGRMCKDIAAQLVEFSYGDGLDVVLGGGRKHFLPQAVFDPEYLNEPGLRQDKRNLIQEWQDRYPNGVYVWNQKQLAAVDIDQVDHLFGLFSYSHMAYEHDREHDVAGEPSLSEMTRSAIRLLSKNPNGFFLMVESGRIDHGHHDGNAYRALSEVIELSKAVDTAVQLTDSKETLIIVTADHSHTMTIGGYATRGNPILGKVVKNDKAGRPKKVADRALDGQPYTTLSYANRPVLEEIDPHDKYDVIQTDYYGRILEAVDTQNPNFGQDGLVPLKSETHAGEDVAIYAQGPWAHLIHRTHEQSFIFYVMKFAAGFGR